MTTRNISISRAGVWAAIVAAMTAVAYAQDDAANIFENVFVPQHQCQEKMPALDAAVAADPDGVRPLLERAHCYYQVGRYEWLSRDLRLALGSKSLSAAIAEARAGGATEAEARAVVEVGSVLQVLLAVDDKESRNIGQARSAYEAGRQTFGDTPAMKRAEIAVVAGGGDAKRAWGLVDAAIDRWPNDPHIRAAVQEMASRDSRGITDKANAFLEAPASSVGWYNEAVQAFQQNDFPRCLQNIDTGLGQVSAEERTRFLNLGYSCAVTSGSVSDSNRFIREVGDVALLRSDVVIRHAALLHGAERNDAALALLERVRPASNSERVEADTLMVRAYTASGNLDAALKVGMRGVAEPASVANLALKLKDAGRPADAYAVLEPTCGRMTGQDAVRCIDLMKRLKG